MTLFTTTTSRSPRPVVARSTLVGQTEYFISDTSLAWIPSFVEEVCDFAGVPTPRTVLAKRGRGKQTFGRGKYLWSYKRVTLTFAHDDAQDDRVLILHELAHHISAHRHGRRDGHSKNFWLVAWDLYQRYDVVTAALAREPGYKSAAGKVAILLGVSGAQEAALAPAKKLQELRTSLTQGRELFAPGDKVVITGPITPAYAMGMTGVVTTGPLRSDGRISAKLDPSPQARGRRLRGGVVINIYPRQLSKLIAP